MKKTVLGILLLAAVLAALLLYRAATVFQDLQPVPIAGIGKVEINEPLAVSRFSAALRFATVSYDDRSNFDADAFTEFHHFLQEAYPQVHQHASRSTVSGYSLIYHLQGSDTSLEPVLFLNHMDVVPVEDITLEEWTHPPFGGVVENGIIWGRGSVDDKLGVISQLEGMELLLAQGFRPQRSIYFAFGHDEEVGGGQGAARIAEHFADQGIRFDFVLDEGGAITQGMIEGADRPVAVIGVSEKGYVNLVLTVNAPGGHSSQPPEQTALGILSKAIVRVEDNPFPANIDPVRQTFEAIGAYMPFQKRLAMGNLWLLSPLVESAMLADKDSAAGIRTTTAATMASGSPKSNILPTRATGVINFRILPGETVDSVKARVVGLIDDERVRVSTEYGINPSAVSSTDSRGYRLIGGTIRGMDENILVAPYMVRGGTDAKYFTTLSPHVYRFLMTRVNPDTVRYIHGIDERIAVEEYLRAIRFYYHLIRQAGES